MSSQRSQSVDLVRIVAVFGVVMIHMAPSTSAAEALTRIFQEFAVPYFLMASLYYFIIRVGGIPSPKLRDLRLERLLAPYIMWTVIYTFLREVKFHMEGTSLRNDTIGVLLFGGGAVHLYFLPLLLFFQALALGVILMSRGGRSAWIGVGIALGAIGFACAGSLGGYFGFKGAPLTGAYYAGLAFVLKRAQSNEKDRRINAIAGWLALAVAISASYPAVAPLLSRLAPAPAVMGYGLCAFALNTRFHTSNRILTMLLTCSYGIYLSHVVFLESLEFAAAKLGYALTPYSLISKVLIAGLICLCSVLLILIARTNRATAYLLLGEAADKTVK